MLNVVNKKGEIRRSAARQQDCYNTVGMLSHSGTIRGNDVEARQKISPVEVMVEGDADKKPRNVDSARARWTRKRVSLSAIEERCVRESAGLSAIEDRDRVEKAQGSAL